MQTCYSALCSVFPCTNESLTVAKVQEEYGFCFVLEFNCILGSS